MKGFLRAFVAFGLFCSFMGEGKMFSQTESLDSLGKDFYVVQKKETLYSISKKFGITVEELNALNPQIKGKLKKGDTLKIRSISSVENKTIVGDTLYKVQKKETLYSISKKFGVTVEELKILNPQIENGLKEGDVLKIASISSSENKVVVGDTLYKVQKKETLYSISKKFGVKTEDLIKLNPDVETSLKSGQVIRIPVLADKKSAGNTTPSEQYIAGQTKISSANTSKSKVNIALLLPFSSKRKKESCIEFYEGFLIGLEEVKSKGISVSLYVYDTEKDTSKIWSLFKDKNEKDIDLVIGDLDIKQEKTISDFCSREKVVLVLPFSKDAKIIEGNPYAFSVIPTENYINSLIIKDICENSSKYYISFLNDASTKIKEDNLISPLKEDLDKKDIPYKTIQISKEQDFSVTLPARLVSDHWNLLIPTMDRRIFLDNYVKKLGEFASSCITYEVSLLGSQEWEKSTAEYLGDFNKLKVQIYTPYSINFDSKEYKNFKSKFSATYSKTLKNLHPSYGVLGYDVVTYFIGGISTCGDNFIYRANSISATGLQSGFQFQREKASDGYINRKVFHITYTK